MIDLWPDDITTRTSLLKPPMTILKEQGTLLGRKTRNIVEGLVVKTPHITSQDFGYTFYLVGPALGDYRYRLLAISFPVSIYPVMIGTDEDIFGELPAEMKAEENTLVADSEEEFMEILRAIFATQKVRQVIGAIIAQSGVDIEQE
jgi:hypothetical protein